MDKFTFRDLLAMDLLRRLQNKLRVRDVVPYVDNEHALEMECHGNVIFECKLRSYPHMGQRRLKGYFAKFWKELWIRDGRTLMRIKPGARGAHPWIENPQFEAVHMYTDPVTELQIAVGFTGNEITVGILVMDEPLREK